MIVVIAVLELQFWRWVVFKKLWKSEPNRLNHNRAAIASRTLLGLGMMDMQDFRESEKEEEIVFPPN